MKMIWIFSVTKGWYKAESSLADLANIKEAGRHGFEQLDTHAQIHRPRNAVKQAVFFQRVKQTKIDYLARYTIGAIDFWFYMPNTAAFVEIFCRHQHVFGLFGEREIAAQSEIRERKK